MTISEPSMAETKGPGGRARDRSKAPALTLLRDELNTPLGKMALITDETGALRWLGWLEGHRRVAPGLGAQIEPTRHQARMTDDPGGATRALRDYFAGAQGVLARVRVAEAGTPFQRKVWRALREIPCGETRSYSELARRIGHPSAVRAVGLANGANPIAIVVPCHRVIGANGTLTGYGGGLERKRWLLDHERALRDPELPFSR